MPTFTTDRGHEYRIDGKHLIWVAEPWDDDDSENIVKLPLRIRLGKLLAIGEDDLTSDNKKMMSLIEAIAPGQEDNVRLLDVNEFQDLFRTWLTTYNSLNGVSLGEAEPLPGS